MEEKTTFVDIDLTLTTFCQDEAVRVVKEKYGEEVGSALGNSWDKFMRVAAGTGSPSDAEAADSLKRFIAGSIRASSGVVPEDIFWSREAMLAWRFPSLTPNKILEIVNAYWQVIGQSGKFYSDTEKFIGAIEEIGFQLYCVSATDGRLYFNHEKDAWYYDSARSAALKRERITLGDLYKLVPREHVIAAEPYSKSDKRFWGKMAMRFRTFGKNVWMIGDSYGSDICGIKSFRSSVNTILLDRKGRVTDRRNAPLANYIVRDLHEAAEIIRKNV